MCHMKDELVLVDPAQLREPVAGRDLQDAGTKEYIETRWLKYVEWWDTRSSNAKRKYQALPSAAVSSWAFAVRPVLGVLVIGALFTALVVIYRRKKS